MEVSVAVIGWGGFRELCNGKLGRRWEVVTRKRVGRVRCGEETGEGLCRMAGVPDCLGADSLYSDVRNWRKGVGHVARAR